MAAVSQQENDVRKFGIYTDDHHLVIEWFKERGITSVAMESTGSYWQTLFDALQSAGFEVILVNGNQIKNVKGKKTDVLDCLWIQKLHSLGLLSGSFLPASQLQKLRTYYGHRQHLVAQTTRYSNKMQKAMRLMNIRLDVALNDIMGQSGRAIVEAILAGERKPVKLASLANYRVKKTKEEIAKSLEGNWREDLLFELRQCLYFYDQYCQKIKECDAELEEKISTMIAHTSNTIKPSVKRKAPTKFSPRFDIEQMGLQYFGVNLFDIKGVSHNTVLCLLTNMGLDINKFPNSKAFCSWLRLCPNNKISGGKVLSSRTPKGKNGLAVAIRQAANSIGNQKANPLTPFFRKIAFKKGRSAAVTATARKLAVIIFNMITKRQPYKSFNYELQAQDHRRKQINQIKSRLIKLKLDPFEARSVLESASFSIT